MKLKMYLPLKGLVTKICASNFMCLVYAVHTETIKLYKLDFYYISL